MPITPIQARAGLNTDSTIDQIGQGYLTDALNAINSAHDGQQINYQNEEGSVFCITPVPGYKCIGIRNIIQLNQTYYFLTNPTTGFSIFGYVPNNQCVFTTLIDDSVAGSDIIGWNILYPIHKVEVKTTNCATQLYFTDRFNVRRYIDLSDLPFKIGTTQVDTNKMAVQPQFSIPEISLGDITVGGNLIEGDYQFAIQYSDIKSNGLTGFYSVTNPVRVFAGPGREGVVYNLLTNNAIPITISELDTTGLYSYFNLAVIKTIQSVTSVEYVGTFPIQRSTYQHTYTGLEQSNTNEPITLSDILRKFEYYDIAGTLTQVDNVLVWADLVKEEDISYQQIFNQVKVHWATSQVPEGTQGQGLGYHNGTVCASTEGYFWDEVYALEGCLLFDNGKQSARFHIPGRIANSFDLQPVGANQDTISIEAGTCPTPVLPRWKVYNTGSVSGYLPGATDPCTHIRPWQYGEMSYWESTDAYPINTAVWGPLAGQPIRHHKFPDATVPGIQYIHDSTNNVYLIGFKVDIQSLYNAIQTSSLTPAQKRSIVGYKIMRSDRAGNRSIEAKGIVSNCGHYQKEGSDFYYANYPFNDVNPDPFISQFPVADKSGAQGVGSWLQDFQRNRFTFHSPDTHFYQTAGIQGSFMKLETAEYGSCISHFVQVKDNAGEKLRTVKAIEIALAAGIVSMVGLNVQITTGSVTNVTVSPTWNSANFFPTYNAMLDIIDKLTPWYNYGWQYNGVGNYNNSIVIPNDVGNKIRYILHGGYIVDGENGTFGDNFPINNTGRESSVYISVNENFPFTHEQVDTTGLNLGVPVDNSRATASQLGLCHSSVPFNRNISSYYCSIKRQVDNQYGHIFSYQVVDTGAQGKFLDDTGTPVTDIPIVYGGDCFITSFALKIKHPFYLKSAVNKGDGYDIDYNQDAPSHTNTGNVGYPIWYYSTSNKLFNIDNTAVSGQITNFMNTFSTPAGIVLSLLTAGLLPLAQAIYLIILLIQNGILTDMGIKITNLDCPTDPLANDQQLYETGEAYLYAYGIINFYVESEVNVDMRQAYNVREGNFYPNVGTGIPDNWLQETNVPIAFDNTYTYNKTFSKQNHETTFPVLRPDWAPNQRCYIDYNNRGIWSDTSSLEETKNNWLVYRPANLFDFPKGFGDLIAIDRLESRTVLVRYQNHYQLYNALATVDTGSTTAVLGTGALFSGSQPIDGDSSDIGYAGTWNRFILNCEQGHVWCDAKRGKVLILRGTSVEDLASPKYLNSKFFQDDLPFQILNYFPTMNVDNHFNGIGLHGVYDNFYKRLIITKIDYIPTDDTVQWDGSQFYVTQTITEHIPGDLTCCPPGWIYYPYIGLCRFADDLELTSPPILCSSETIQTQVKVPITLGDPLYFCNKSLTMSFSFLSNSWISPHSYIPNFYIEHENYFQAGMNTTEAIVYDHNSVFNLFTNFFGVQYPYILEYPFSYNQKDHVVQQVEEYLTVLKYSSFTIYTEPDDNIYFTQAVLYNNQASTGLLNLIPKSLTNQATYRSYPRYNTDSIDILVSKVLHNYSYNMIWNNQVDVVEPQWIANCSPQDGNKDLNTSNFNYGVKSFRKFPLMAKDCKVRHIRYVESDPYKLISRFTLTKTQDTYS